jgi:hypothetical protein
MENHNSTHKMLISRGTAIQMIVSALHHGKTIFVRELVLSWLGKFSGDLEMQYFLAKTYQMEDHPEKAIEIINEVLAVDPQYLEAYMLKAELPISNEEKDVCFASIHALGGTVQEKRSLPMWSPALHAVGKAISNERFEDAAQLVYRILSIQQEIPLVSLFHLQTVYLQQDENTILKLAEMYHNKWPRVIATKMILAEKKLETGEEEEAVALLHDCVSKDSVGIVARRWWGDQHNFLPLWPDQFEINIDLQIPNEVIFDLGWNVLPEPDLIEKIDLEKSTESIKTNPNAEKTNKYISSEVGKEVEKEFERINEKLKNKKGSMFDGRFPAYTIFTTKTGLVKEYGEQTYQVILQHLRQIQLLIKSKPGWDAVLCIPDDEIYRKEFNLTPVKTIDAGTLRLSIQELDSALSKRGERIGALLIIGGDEIVPFHRLPNPTDDADEDVFSDNPYSALDGNYFVPDWPTGRLVGEAGADAGLLIQQIRSVKQYHSQPKSVKRFWEYMLRSILGMINQKTTSSFGYTASVWKRSSIAVYKTLGDSKNVFISPNGKTKKLPFNFINEKELGYYNLHGMEKESGWYGQRDFLDPPGDDYPVALIPDDIKNNGKQPKIVFTEACFGAHVFGKNETESNALKFLSVGTPIVVGSTCTSYGSITTPLIAADLLSKIFWQNIRSGLWAGEALQKAKISLVQEMMKRQGYLDGEDQKTLIQFVLYGDPFFAYEGSDYQKKKVNPFEKVPQIKTVSDLQQDQKEMFTIPSETIAQVKSILMPYLPGIEHAKLKTNLLHYGEKGEITHKGEQVQSIKTVRDRVVVTLQNPININKQTSFQIARVTLDSKGKILKTVVSR